MRSRRYNQVTDAQSWAPLDSAFWPGTGWKDLLWSGVVIGAAVFVALLALGLFVWQRWGIDLQPWLSASGLVSVLSGAAIIVWRQLRYERDELLQRHNLRIQREQNQTEFESMHQVASDVVEGREPTSSRRDLVFRRMMRRYYAGWPITREACVKSGMCNFAEWNAVSKLMATRGIRKGRAIVPKSRTEALRVWYDAEDKARRFKFVDGEPVARE